MKNVVKYIATSLLPVIPEKHLVRSRCYLCGSKKSLDVDHVIPKVFFSPCTTTTYLKLWACKKCNKLKGKEDEYVARCLQTTSFIETAKKGFDEAIRGFKKGHGMGIGIGILDNVLKYPIKTRHGEFSEVLKLDKRRFNDYLKTIAKGLFVRNTLELYDWNEYEFECGIDQAMLDMKLYEEEPFRTIWAKASFGEYWQHIFTYRGGVVGLNSVWVMCFYSSFFAAVTIHKKDNKK